jgi:transcriptional regulator with XRE-family HTH domain
MTARPAQLPQGGEAAVAGERDAVAAMRRELGRQLASRRREAGYLQRELGVLLGYSRTAVANAEIGSPGIGRQLWERADLALGTGELFARGWTRIQAQVAAESRASAGRPVPGAGSRAPGEASGQPADGLESLTPGTALRACLQRGWPAEEDPDGRLWLVTGTVIDALEVPRQAGMLAMSWWLYTRGVPDEIRGLPALPDPAGALAVVTAGSRCYFLTQSGACPWTRRDVAAADVAGSAGTVVRWHSHGGRVLAPPSRLSGGERAAWEHVPSGGGQLVSPMALLHALAQAVAATREGAGVILPGGVRAVPAAGASLASGSRRKQHQPRW